MNRYKIKFNFRLNDQLPLLSWLLKYKKNQELIHILHGSWVEHNDKFFVEGIWSGEFKKGKFDEAVAFFGSGGRLSNKGIVISTPTNGLERIYLTKRNDEIIVSNSLPFILSMLNDELDTNYRFYRFDYLELIGQGTKRLEKNIFTKFGNKIYIFHYCNLLITPELEIIKRRNTKFKEFDNFSEYRDYLTVNIRKIFNNSMDNSRKIVYDSISTVSSGYDSNACSVLVSNIGCENAITIKNSRQKFDLSDDSGKRIAEKLNLSAIEKERTEYLKLDNMPEADFMACGELEDVIYANWGNILKKKFLITGVHGDTVWSCNSNKVNSNIQRPDLAGVTLSEFRLKIGFIHVPVPFIGACNFPSIYKISNSDEMKPWRLNTEYDRPIPRRIVEEAGIPREWFGVKKMAVTQPFHFVSENDLKYIMTSSSYSDFMSFVKKHRDDKGLKREIKTTIMRFIYKIDVYFLKAIHLMAKILNVNKRYKPHIDVRYKIPTSDKELAIHWATTIIKKRYKV